MQQALRYPDGDYAITAMYSVPDDAWYLELDLVAGQRTLVTAIVPDEDSAREPTVCFTPNAGHTDVPYEVMRWFMHQVDEEIRTSRAWMQLRPELVEIIYQLRQEHMGVIGDDDFPQMLADVRTTVPEEDLPDVLEAAFGRNPDGTTMPPPANAPACRRSRRQDLVVRSWQLSGKLRGLTLTDVLIRRGVAGLPSVSRSEVPGNYPYEAIRVAKLIRAAGLTVEFEDEKPDRTYLTHDAAEFWLPIIEFARDIGKETLIATLSGLVSSYATMKILRRGDSSGQELAVPSPVLHVEVTRQGDLTTKLVLDGPADSVLEAITRIERWGSEDERRQLPEG